MNGATIQVPIDLLRRLLLFLERGAGSRRQRNPSRSLLIDEIRNLLERAA